VFLGSGCGSQAAGAVPPPSSYSSSIERYPRALSTACRLEHTKELGYAGFLNSLGGLNPGTILVYAIVIGDPTPMPTNNRKDREHYEAFNLFLVNKIKSKDIPSDSKLPTPGQSIKGGVDTMLYRDHDGLLWSIEPMASVTFNGDTPDGSFEGWGGLLSYTEYGDMIAYLQTRPFQLTWDWKSTLSKPGSLSACNIKWTETDRYLHSVR